MRRQEESWLYFREGQTVAERDFKTGIVELPAAALSTSGFDHFRNWICAHNLALRSDQIRNGQCWFSGARRHVEDRVAAGDRCVLNKSLGDWGKHLEDHRSVLFPKGSRFAPFGNNFFILHKRERLDPRFRFLTCRQASIQLPAAACKVTATSSSRREINMPMFAAHLAQIALCAVIMWDGKPPTLRHDAAMILPLSGIAEVS